MIIIAQPYARYRDTIDVSDLKSGSAALLEYAEAVVAKHYRDVLRGEPISVEVRVETGSTRAWIKVLAGLHILILYGEIRHGVDYLIKDARELHDIIAPHVPTILGLGNTRVEVTQRRLGVPGELRRLFDAVERHEMSAKDATQRAVELLNEAEGRDITRTDRRLAGQLAREFKQSFKRGHGPVRHPQRRDTPTQPVAVDTTRRIGVVAERDKRTGKVRVRSY